ncbi:uncharacterized protein LOC105433472 [Pogonomyrmex barbatus]|uniref:Uncharacterized protein LOC105433472 n=1 Tax=Pogonomyrmex barbatus TaxID=144034 RepID=A0A6I9X3C8_9HYME|nr:uncharacterized protein LOC105433472 [Pogonomyrmex barbatus]
MDVFKETQQEKVEEAPSINHSETKESSHESDLIYGKKLQSPILGYHHRLPDLPTNSIPLTTLDTSLLHIPVYAHLKIYDLKPVQLPEAPSILSTLHPQFSEGTMLNESSKEISSTARLSEEDGVSASYSARSSTKIANKKRQTEM